MRGARLKKCASIQINNKTYLIAKIVWCHAAPTTKERYPTKADTSDLDYHQKRGKPHMILLQHHRNGCCRVYQCCASLEFISLPTSCMLRRGKQQRCVLPGEGRGPSEDEARGRFRASPGIRLASRRGKVSHVSIAAMRLDRLMKACCTSSGDRIEAVLASHFHSLLTLTLLQWPCLWQNNRT